MSTVLLATLKAVFVDGSTPVRSRPAVQPLAIAQYTAGHILVECVNSDGSPHSLAYDVLLLGVRLHPTDANPAIALQATNLDTDPSGNPADNWARFELVPGHWLGVPPRIYEYDVASLFGGNPDDRSPGIPASQFRVTNENIHPGDNIQVPTSQQPIGRGPESEIRIRHTVTAGDVTSIMSIDGFSIVWADEGIVDAEDDEYGLSYDLISGNGYPSFRGTSRTVSGFFLNVSGDVVEGDVIEIGRKPGASDPSRGPAGATGATGETGAKGDKGDTGDAGSTGPAGPAPAGGTDGQIIRRVSGVPAWSDEAGGGGGGSVNRAVANLGTDYEVDIGTPSVALTANITTTGGDLFINVSGLCEIFTGDVTSGTGIGQWLLVVDGVTVRIGAVMNVPAGDGTGNAQGTIAMSALVQGLAASAHTIQVKGQYFDGGAGGGGSLAVTLDSGESLQIFVYELAS